MLAAGVGLVAAGLFTVDWQTGSCGSTSGSEVRVGLWRLCANKEATCVTRTRDDKARTNLNRHRTISGNLYISHSLPTERLV